MSLGIYYSRPEDLFAITTIHLSCFPDSFSAKMGEKFAMKMLEWHLSGNNKFLVHVVSNFKIVGYAGCLIPEYAGDGSTSGIIRYALRQSFTSFLLKPYLLFKSRVIKLYPLIFKNIFRKFFKYDKNNRRFKNLIPENEKCIKIVVIGIDPVFRGKGIAEEIFTFLSNKAVANNYAGIALSVKKENKAAVKSYLKNGFKIEKEGKDYFEMKNFLTK